MSRQRRGYCYQSGRQLMGQQISRSDGRASVATLTSELADIDSDCSDQSHPSPARSRNSSISSSSSAASETNSIHFSSCSETGSPRRNRRALNRPNSIEVLIDLSSSSDENNSSNSTFSSRMSSRTLRSQRGARGGVSTTSSTASSSSSSSGSSSSSSSTSGSSIPAAAPVRTPLRISVPLRRRIASASVRHSAVAQTREVLATSPRIGTPQLTRIIPPPMSVQNSNILNCSMQSVTFECIVCLENLGSPATVLDEVHREDVADPPMVQILLPLGSGWRGARRGRGGSAVRSAARKLETLAGLNPREIASTPCGHMYHRYCIEKWFNEQGKKTCPSCRKTVTGKIIRLYPNIGQDTGTRTLNLAPVGVPVQQEADSISTGVTAGPSTSASAHNNGSLQPREVPNHGCNSPACADLKVLHSTLVSDFNDLREKFHSLSYDLDIRNAEILSLQESHDKQTEEISELKANNGVTGAKRRRQR